MEDVYRTNVIGPMMLTQALAGQLKAYGKSNEHSEKALVVNMSSILGSLANNPSKETGKGEELTKDKLQPLRLILSTFFFLLHCTGGGIYQYRASKAALNMLTRCFAVDLARSGVQAVSIHPGWVSTDMGGPNAPVTPKESIEGVIKIIQQFKDEQNGQFLDYQGNTVDW